jgi:cation-transporting ATPase E
MTELATPPVGPARPALAPELVGLTAGEVAERVASGRTNDVPNPTSRTYGQIIRANVFTRFNALLGVLLVAILAVREYKDALFGIVLVLNTAIGIIQESRAKQTLDKLTLLSAPHAKVRRDGTVHEVTTAEDVLDDVVDLAPGDQISVDGVVVAGRGFEVDESLLTGEVDPVVKEVGDEVLSGSFVAAGSGVIRATKVGVDAYAFKIREDASRFTLVKSELRDGVNRILKIVTWLMIPTAVLLVSAQIRFQNKEGHELTLDERVTDAVQGSVAGLVAMVPEGLVLLTSMAFALGIIRLGRKNVLTQELAAIEGLARVDVICLDKTGTLTEGALALDAVDLLETSGTEDHTGEILASLVVSDPNPNPSLVAIGARFDHDPGWRVDATVPFSSARKWAAADFGSDGAWFLGAPEILLTSADPERAAAVTERIAVHAEQGRRVIMLASSSDGLDGETLPTALVPHALVVLAERIRHDAPDTIGYFLDQGVKVKVISGDNPVTVGAVAQRVGVPGADHPIDARTLPPNDDIAGLAEVLEANSVFGRVTPQQKRAMVHALQSKGHEVAMTGDGVNDTLALKDAEIGIAMGSGSPAARSVARFVILDNSFAVFPSVVTEGRRVIANVERVANLFLTKTFYAMMLSITVGIFGLAFPFFPRHFTLISALTIGVPAFFLALAPNSTRARPGFLPRVLRFAIPAGVTAFIATFATYVIATRTLEGQFATDEALMQSRTAATLTLFCVAIAVLSILARPWEWWKALLVGAMVAGFLLVLWVPPLHNYFAIDLPEPALVWTAVGIGIGAGILLEIATRVFKLVEHPVREGRDTAAALASRPSA